MKVMRKLSTLAAGTAVAAIATFAGTGLALADGGPGKRVVYEKPWDWGGLYFGVHSGWQWSTDISVTPGYVVDHDSAVVGGQIGIQHQFGQIVLGVEGNLTTTYQNNSSAAPCPAAGFTCAARLDDIL